MIWIWRRWLDTTMEIWNEALEESWRDFAFQIFITFWASVNFLSSFELIKEVI
jgi:hypothetical protein